jgi:hypothetical protein
MNDIVDYVNGLKSLSGLRVLTAEQSDFLFDAADEIERLRNDAQAAPRMTFDEWFLKFSSWGLSHQQLLTCAFAPGSDPVDDVYTSPSGSVMTRHICSHWINFYGAAQAGWNAALSSAQCKETVK